MYNNLPWKNYYLISKDDVRGFFLKTLRCSNEDEPEFSDQEVLDEITTMLIGVS